LPQASPNFDFSISNDFHLSDTISIDFISELINAIETKNKKPSYHSLRVAIISYHIGIETNLTKSELSNLFFAAILHDIGASSVTQYIDESLLETPDIFTQRTSFYLFEHPYRSYTIVNQFPCFKRIGKIVHSHHELFDGTGYPRCLKGMKIPFHSRIIRIADSADITIRFNKITNSNDLISLLEIFNGDEFDPEIFKFFVKMIKKTDLISIFQDETLMIKHFNELKQQIESKQYLSSVDILNSFFETTANIIDNITSPTRFHSIKLTEFAEQIATEMGLGRKEILETRWACLLHDIGKLTLNRSIFFDKNRLSDDNWNQIKMHPEESYRILKNIKGLENISKYILHHHENFDGTGYPNKLTGEQVPLISRVIRIADAFEAMTSDRFFQRKKDWNRAAMELKKQAGKQFDPKIADIATKIFSKN